MSYPVVDYQAPPLVATPNHVVLAFVANDTLVLPAVDAADTLTVSQLLAYDSFRKAVTLTANRALNLPTAAALVAGMPGCTVGTALRFNVETGALSGGGNVVVTAGTGGTALGYMQVPTTWQSTFRVVVTNNSSGTEAYQVQRLS